MTVTYCSPVPAWQGGFAPALLLRLREQSCTESSTHVLPSLLHLLLFEARFVLHVVLLMQSIIERSAEIRWQLLIKLLLLRR